jgi:dipeptidyl aminopeptidase/acylaminoacyl peptidase
MFRLGLLAAVAAVVCAVAGAAGGATGDHLIVFPGTAEGSNVTQLFAVEPSGANLRQLTTGSYAALYPAFSPAGTRLAFARFGVGLFTVNPDGSGLRRLTTNGRDSYPTWSPNGKTVAFVRPVGPAWKVFLVAAKGGKPQQLKHSPAAGRPTWTKPQGLLIPTAADLLRIDPKSGKVLKYFGAELDAIWGLNSVEISPGVSNLTYVGTRDPVPGDQDCGDGPCQRYGLYLENLRTKVKKARLIVKDAGSATFSADGKRIAFVGGGVLNIRTLASGATSTVATTGATPVQQGPPAWR